MGIQTVLSLLTSLHHAETLVLTESNKEALPVFAEKISFGDEFKRIDFGRNIRLCLIIHGHAKECLGVSACPEIETLHTHEVHIVFLKKLLQSLLRIRGDFYGKHVFILP
jgi:hypothetical protein